MTAPKHLAGTHRGAVHVAFAAVRLTEGREWIDLETLSGDRIQTERKVVITNKALGLGGLGAWLKDNPVIRIAEVTVREVSEVVEVKGDYTQARGILPLEPGAELPEERIRRTRGGQS